MSRQANVRNYYLQFEANLHGGGPGPEGPRPGLGPGGGGPDKQAAAFQAQVAAQFQQQLAMMKGGMPGGACRENPTALLRAIHRHAWLLRAS